jgi:hypothetical protein
MPYVSFRHSDCRFHCARSGLGLWKETERCKAQVQLYLTINNTFFFATIDKVFGCSVGIVRSRTQTMEFFFDKVFYYVSSVLTNCFGLYIRPSSGEFSETCREYRRYKIKHFVNCCETEGIIYSLILRATGCKTL